MLGPKLGGTHLLMSDEPDVNKVRAENERLRAALRDILGLAVHPELGGGLINAKRIAREALKITG